MKYPAIKEIVRTLRKNPTLSERNLWKHLRNKQLMGMKFLRQHPIFYQRNFNNHYFFVADFYCHEARLVIELDGPIHEFTKWKDYNRDVILGELGLEVLHIRNEELENIQAVIKKIENKIIDLL